MKLVLISDLHFGVKKSDKIFLDNQLKFLKNELVEYMKKNKLDQIVILGDLFDTRNSLNSYMKSEVFKFFEFLNENKIKVIIFPGNHDIYYRTTIQVHSLDFLKKFENVEVLEEVTLKEMDGKKLLFVPWCVDYEEHKKRIANKNNHCDVCFGHFDIAGFPYDNSRICQEGIDTNVFLSNYTLTFSGHFHKRNVYKRGTEEIVMIGSPYQITRNDRNDERGFCVLDVETLKYEFVNSKKTIKFVELNYPQEFTKEMIQGNVVDVHVNYNGNNIGEEFRDYVSKIEKLKPAYTPNISVNNTLFDNIDQTNYEVKSLSELINEFIENLKIENKETIKNMINELYGRAKGE